MNVEQTTDFRQKLVLITGPSGSGRQTALHSLEDIGYETIDNLPISLVRRLVRGSDWERPMALGLDPRNRDFGAQAMYDLLSVLRRDEALTVVLLFLDARTEVLTRRYSETRRRHPLARDGAPLDGIKIELDLLQPLRQFADHTLDTSDFSPHDLRAELARIFTDDQSDMIAISIESFSYKKGVPQGADMVFDCRFLDNPHWQPDLRPLTGLDPRVADHVASDPKFSPFFGRVDDLITSLLPAFKAEGKSHLTIAFGCTGGRHRSVSVAERLALSLANKGWRVSTYHRGIEGQGNGSS